MFVLLTLWLRLKDTSDIVKYGKNHTTKSKMHINKKRHSVHMIQLYSSKIEN